MKDKKKKTTLFYGYTADEIYGALWKELKRFYIGEGLYISINSIAICDPCVVEGDDPEFESCMISGSFGREGDEENPNIFQEDFEIMFEKGDTLDYIAGRFGAIVNNS
ncbi:MAG: hypothetical protein J6S67_08615 [Methanobrevibacter sp.]|nr:hypothetical protein [Methanobrevibacter sp.]